VWVVGWLVGWLADWIVAGVTVTRVLKQHLAVARKLFSTSICCVAKTAAAAATAAATAADVVDWVSEKTSV